MVISIGRQVDIVNPMLRFAGWLQQLTGKYDGLRGIRILTQCLSNVLELRECKNGT
jgi:hypothetical protein